MDWKTWGVRLAVVGAAAGLYVLAGTVLAGNDVADPIKSLAGLLVGLLLPQMAAKKGE